MNYNKVIKDLKERNDKLQEQYTLRDIRCIHLEYENEMLKSDFEAQHELTKKYAEENQELKSQLEEYKRLGFEHLNNKCNKLENQQKEFVEYLEEEMKKNINWYNSLTPHDKNYYYKDYVDKDTNYMVVLSKYKEIIGGKE